MKSSITGTLTFRCLLFFFFLLFIRENPLKAKAVFPDEFQNYKGDE